MTTIPRRGPTISSEWLRGQDWLVRELRFRDYNSALGFAELIGKIEDFGHHPDVCVSGDSGARLRLTVRNLNHVGVTEQELRLASKLDTAIAEHYNYDYGSRPATGEPTSIEAIAQERDGLVAA